jgi:hypothetical protein
MPSADMGEGDSWAFALHGQKQAPLVHAVGARIATAR